MDLKNTFRFFFMKKLTKGNFQKCAQNYVMYALKIAVIVGPRVICKMTVTANLKLKSQITAEEIASVPAMQRVIVSLDRK